MSIWLGGWPEGAGRLQVISLWRIFIVLGLHLVFACAPDRSPSLRSKQVYYFVPKSTTRVAHLLKNIF